MEKLNFNNETNYVEPFDDKLIYIKGNFFKNLFNREFVTYSYDYCFRNNGPCEKAVNKFIHNDPIYKMIEELCNHDYENHKNLKDNNSQSIQISIDQGDANIEDTQLFQYTQEISQIITDKFFEFGMFKDFETLIKSANSMYRDNDEVSFFDKLLQKNQRLREIVLGKMDHVVSIDAILRFQLEAAMISKVYEEIDKRVAVRKNKLIFLLLE